MTNLELRPRENMSTLLLDQDHIIAKIQDPRYEGLLENAALLREHLSVCVFILDNLAGISIDTAGMKRVLEDSGLVMENGGAQ